MHVLGKLCNRSKNKGSEINTPKIEIYTPHFIIVLLIFDLMWGVDFNFWGVYFTPLKQTPVSNL